MSDTHLERMLSKAFSDGTVGRAELQGLRDEIFSRAPTAPQLAELRSHAFSLLAQRLSAVPEQQACTALARVIELLIPTGAGSSEGSGGESLAEAFFSPGDACRERIERALDEARHSIDICVFTITDDRLSRRIEAAHRRRVAVRIISDDDKAGDRGSDIERLQRAGISVRVDRTDNHMHHKFAPFDQRVLLTGSYNWTRSAFRFNQENIALTDDTRLLRSFTETFEQLWAKFSS